MKKLFAFVCCLFSVSALASEWGVLGNFTRQMQATARQEEVKYPFLIFSILKGKPVKIYLSKLEEEEKEDDQILAQDLAKALANNPQPSTENTLQDTSSFRQLVAQSYNTWFTHTAQTIRKSGRENEFADILPLLDRGIQVEFVNDLAQADIRVIITKNLKILRENCGPNNLGCYVYSPDFSEQPILFLSAHTPFYFRRDSTSFALHEIGHSLGLSDQYISFLSGGRNNSDAVHSTPNTPASIMKRARRLTCDDADGIINLIDLAKGKFHGGSDGWESLCKRTGLRYIQGIPNTKGPYFIDMAEEEYPFGTIKLTTVTAQPDHWQQTVKEFSPSQTETYSPFNEPTFTVDQRDTQGRPLHATAEGGLEAFYMYHYEMTWRIVTHGNTLLLSDRKTSFDLLNIRRLKKQKQLANRAIIFSREGKTGAIVIELNRQDFPWRNVVYFQNYNEDNKDFKEYGFIKVYKNSIELISEIPLHVQKENEREERQLYFQMLFDRSSDVDTNWPTLREQLAKLGSED